MSNFKQGNIWNMWGLTGLFVITGNSEIDSRGNLVMGAGIAKEAKERLPGIEDRLGRMIQKMDNPFYGLIVLNGVENDKGIQQDFGILQTKYSWRQDSNILLVQRSLSDLFFFLLRQPKIKVDMVAPGIGHGRLNPGEVAPMMQLFPDTVNVWRND